MKAYFLPLGDGADRALPAILTALSCGAARQANAVSMLRVPAAAPGSLTDKLLEDLNRCHDLLSGREEIAFFRTRWESRLWLPALPERSNLIENEESRLLLQALRGDGVPFSFRTDPEAAEWSLAALLEQMETAGMFSSPGEQMEPDPSPGHAGSGILKPFRMDQMKQTFSEDQTDSNIRNASQSNGMPDAKGFLSFLEQIQNDLDAGEQVRLLLLCDLTEGYAAGLAFGLLRFLRSRFDGENFFLGLIGQVRGAGAEGQGARAAKDALSALRDRGLVRAAEGRETAGADACWLLGLPAALLEHTDACRMLDWAAARVLGEAWTGAEPPAPGLHTREIPGILTLHTFDQEARSFAAFLRSSAWCLSDLFPSLQSWFDHPAPLRSLAPASRGGLFRRLFRESGSHARPPELAALERAFRALNLEILRLFQSLPPLLREAEPASNLWRRAVQACGRAVTLASEYDVRRQEAEDSGVDKVQPVHRVSLSDTEEEELLRKLDQLAAQVSAAEAVREEIFREGGGCLARAALEDCLAKCQEAEKSAREKMIQMPAGTPEERYALGMQERRIRLLRAAVTRCRQDLTAAGAWNALHQPGTLRSAGPLTGEILEPALADHLFTLLTGEGETAENAAKALRDGIGGLLRGYALNDAKNLLRNLLSACRQPETDVPLRDLMAGVFSVCGVEVSGLRLQSRGDLPDLSLLPDHSGEDRYFTLAAAPERILAPSAADQTALRRGLLALMVLREYRRRNLNEAALELLPLAPEASALVRVYLSSRGAERAYLCSLRVEAGENTRRQPLAILLPGMGLEPARLQSATLDLIPSFAFWLDRENQTLLDPCPWLSEGDRSILTEQLTRLRAELNDSRGHGFASFLGDFHQDINQAPRLQEEDHALRERLRVACGLTRLPIWQKDLQRVASFYESALTEDPVCGALRGGSGPFEAASGQIREDVIYAFRGTPVAREHPEQLLVATHAPGEDYCLRSLNTECDILSHSSDDYHEALAEGLQELLRRFPGADPEAAARAEKLLAEAQEPLTERITELNWPWDTVSASVLTILTECLGKDMAPAALQAFSGKLALFPARGGEILGDVLLNQMCVLRREIPEKEAETDSAFGGTGDRGAQAYFSAPVSAFPTGFPEMPIPPESASSSVPGTFPGTPVAPGSMIAPEESGRIPPDAVLPPLSPVFAKALCRSPQGQSLLQPGFLQFAAEGASVRAEITLEGAFTLRLVRVYGPEEIQTFYAHDLPTLALWPSLPFPAEAWHAYYSYVHASPEFGVTVLSRDAEIPLSGSAPRMAACHEEFPLCYLLSWQGESIGAVPNLLPSPQIPEGGAWTACLDFGASAASVVFTEGERRWPMQGPVTVRTLLRHPAATEALLWREFLPAVPVSALIPCALRIFRNDLAEADLPLRDGAIFMSASLRDVLEVSPEALYTDLKWNGEKGRALRMYLHQVMLMAALQARCGGARELGWRAALPEEMAPEGRERMAEILTSLASEVSAESALPLPEKHPPVAFAAESTALSAYFRFCAPEETRGGFMMLDLGADTADLSLCLQGREEAVRVCQLPLGLHNILLPALLRRPALLAEDFGFVEAEDFQRDLRDLQALLEKAARDPAALRQARYGLDAILADHFSLFLQVLGERRAAGEPGRTGALILLHESFLMMLSGLILLQIAGDSLRNDTLPDAMTLFLAGRGSLMMESLSPQAKTSLWKMLTMFRNPRVRSINLVFSAEKKMEIPVGLSVLPHPSAALPHPAAAPAAIAVRPEELMPEFLLRFRREFPEEAALLFPGVYANDYYAPFTPYGQMLLSQALQAAFDRREAGRPISGLVACLTHLLEMMQEGGIP